MIRFYLFDIKVDVEVKPDTNNFILKIEITEDLYSNLANCFQI